MNFYTISLFADKRFRSLTLVNLRVNDERYETAVTGKLPE